MARSNVRLFDSYSMIWSHTSSLYVCGAAAAGCVEEATQTQSDDGWESTLLYDRSSFTVYVFILVIGWGSCAQSSSGAQKAASPTSTDGGVA
jgi:hypothetical protein